MEKESAHAREHLLQSSWTVGQNLWILRWAERTSVMSSECLVLCFTKYKTQNLTRSTTTNWNRMTADIGNKNNCGTFPKAKNVIPEMASLHQRFLFASSYWQEKKSAHLKTFHKPQIGFCCQKQTHNRCGDSWEADWTESKRMTMNFYFYHSVLWTGRPGIFQGSG